MKAWHCEVCHEESALLMACDTCGAVICDDCSRACKCWQGIEVGMRIQPQYEGGVAEEQTRRPTRCQASDGRAIDRNAPGVEVQALPPPPLKAIP